MACRLFGAKPYSKPMLGYSKFEIFHSRNCIWKCFLPKWQPFCPGAVEFKKLWNWNPKLFLIKTLYFRLHNDNDRWLTIMRPICHELVVIPTHNYAITLPLLTQGVEMNYTDNNVIMITVFSKYAAISHLWIYKAAFQTLRPGQNGWFSVGEIIKCIFFKEHIVFCSLGYKS